MYKMIGMILIVSSLNAIVYNVTQDECIQGNGEWKATGMSTYGCIADKEFKKIFEEKSKWKKVGSGNKQDWNDIGVTSPKIAQSWVDSGFSVEDAEYMIKQGYKTPKAAKKHLLKFQANRVKNTHPMKAGKEYKCGDLGLKVSVGDNSIIAQLLGMSYNLYYQGTYKRYKAYVGIVGNNMVTAKLYTRAGIGKGKNSVVNLSFSDYERYHCEEIK